MELSGGGDADGQQVQYITTDDDQQQQYVVQGDGAEGQTLLQGAKIVDGQLVLPQHYVTNSGETVILVYETPDGGQQFMTEDGQQIVFQQEGAEEGQSVIDPAQVLAHLQQQSQESEQEMEGQQMISTDQGHIAPGQSLLAPNVTMASSEQSQIASGQSLLTSQTTFVQEHEDGSTSVVTDPEQIAALMAQQHVVMQGESEPVMVGESEGMSILSQAVSAIENGDNLSQQISVQSLQQGQSFPQNVKFENYDLPITSDMINSEGPTTLMADGKEIQVQVLSNADFAASQGGASNEPPLETLKLRQHIKDEEAGEMQVVMKSEDDMEGQTYIEATTTDGNRIILSGIDADSPEMAILLERIKNNQVQISEDGTVTVTADDIKGEYGQMEGQMVIVDPDLPVYEFGPGVINPETGDMEEPEENVFTEPEPDVRHEELFVEVGETEDILNQANAMADGVKLQVEIFNEHSNKPEVTFVNVPASGDKNSSLYASDDSDFDEENLTPKVVYERLLAQHRRTKECQVCGELLENFLRLKEHLMEHAGYNPCECQKCGRILSTPEGRYRHEKAHEKQGSPQKGLLTPPQKVTCQVCGKIIARKEHLKRHMLIHQDCPTFKCLLCGYSFKREDLIKGHVKKFHPKQVEASSLELLFEKSSDDLAPEKSQWNPHRKYRSTPKPPKIPGRARGRPRKETDDDNTPGGLKQKRAPRPKKLKEIVIKTPDGTIVTPSQEETFDQLVIKREDGTIIMPKSSRSGKRPIKTPKRFEDDEVDDDDDDDDIYDDDDYDYNSSEEESSQLLVRHALDDEGTTDFSESSSSFPGEKPSKTSKGKKAKSVARMEGKDVPLWSRRKIVKCTFVGVGEEMEEPYESVGNEIEEEIVVVMGGKGNTKIKSVKLVKTPQAAKNRGLAKGPTPSPTKYRGTPKIALKQKSKTPATIEKSRSGRVIKRKEQADGEFATLPKKIHVELVQGDDDDEDYDDDDESPQSKSGKSNIKNIVRIEVSRMSQETPSRGRPRKLKQEDDGSDTPRTGTKRTASRLDDSGDNSDTPASKRTRGKVASDTTKRTTVTSKSELMSEVKTVKCSTPSGTNVARMLAVSDVDVAATPSRAKDDRAKPSTSKATAKEDKPSKSSTSKDKGSSPEASPKRKDVTSSPKPEYGTVTIEQGRIVGEIKLSKSPVEEEEEHGVPSLEQQMEGDLEDDEAKEETD